MMGRSVAVLLLLALCATLACGYVAKIDVNDKDIKDAFDFVKGLVKEHKDDKINVDVDDVKDFVADFAKKFNDGKFDKELEKEVEDVQKVVGEVYDDLEHVYEENKEQMEKFVKELVKKVSETYETEYADAKPKVEQLEKEIEVELEKEFKSVKSQVEKSLKKTFKELETEEAKIEEEVELVQKASKAYKKHDRLQFAPKEHFSTDSPLKTVAPVEKANPCIESKEYGKKACDASCRSRISEHKEIHLSHCLLKCATGCNVCCNYLYRLAASSKCKSDCRNN
eukprot:Nk52_evm8s301 gene=Nk52_evmTU8s301